MRNVSTICGTTTLETLVAFSLLASVLSLALPLVVQNGRMLADQRGYRLALDELSNQLDRLTALPTEDVSAALQELALSDFARTRLSGAELSGELEAMDIGGRITLRLSWDGRHPHTLALAAWAFPAPDQSDNPPLQEAEP